MPGCLKKQCGSQSILDLLYDGCACGRGEKIDCISLLRGPCAYCNKFVCCRRMHTKVNQRQDPHTFDFKGGSSNRRIVIRFCLFVCFFCLGVQPGFRYSCFGCSDTNALTLLSLTLVMSNTPHYHCEGLAFSTSTTHSLRKKLRKFGKESQDILNRRFSKWLGWMQANPRIACLVKFAQSSSKPPSWIDSIVLVKW